MRLAKARAVQAVVSVGAVALILALLTACGADPTATPVPTATPTAAPDATPTPTPPPTPTPDPLAAFEALVVAAQAEGQLVPVTTGGSAQAMGPLLKIWSEKYGISVSQQRGRGTDTVPKILAERGFGRYTVDTWQSGPGSANQIADAGGMRPFEEAAVHPNVADKSFWRGGIWRFVDSHGQFMFAYAANIDHESVFYNTNLVSPDDINSVFDMLQPKWKGMIARDRVPQTDSLARTYVLEGGKEYLEELWSGGYIRLIEDVRTCEDSLARGTVAFASCGAQSNLPKLKGQGFPVEQKRITGFPSWRVGSGTSIGLMDQAPHPNAAKLWINWLVGPEGWEARKQVARDDLILSVSTTYQAMSLRTDVTNEHISDDLKIGPDEDLYILITDPKYIDTLQEAIEWIRPIVVAAGFPSPPDRHPDLIGS